MLIRYQGNWPSNVSRDAKYSVRQEGQAWVIAILYKTPTGERWYPTTSNHPQLIRLVNSVKVSANTRPGGPFYLNEWRQVIVPDAKGNYYYAGEYSEDLEFKFEGVKISGKPLDLHGRRLSPGDEWAGPHAGIPYLLRAGGKDIGFEQVVRPRVTRIVNLSDCVGPQPAASIASRIVKIAGFQGGRFYVNEFRQFFKPMSQRSGVRYLYVGELGEDEPWLPKPHADLSGRNILELGKMEAPDPQHSMPQPDVIDMGNPILGNGKRGQEVSTAERTKALRELDDVKI